MFSPKNWWPGIRAILGIVQQRLQERRLDAFQVGAGLAHQVAGNELRRVLEHMDDALELAQDVVREMARRLGLPVDVDRHVGIAASHLADEFPQRQQGRRQAFAMRQFLVVDRQDEGAGPALLLRELAEIAIAGGAEHLETLRLDCFGQHPDAQAGGVLGTEVFVNDDDRKLKQHRCPRSMDGRPRGSPASRTTAQRHGNPHGAMRCRFSACFCFVL